MDSNWKLLDDKWPAWGLDKRDGLVADLSNCSFIGDGRQEIVVFTFPRYKRLAKAKAQSTYPVCIALGQSFESNLNNEVPAISVMRCLDSNKAGLFERADFLSVVSTANGPALVSWISDTFSSSLVNANKESSWKWLNVNAKEFLGKIEAFLTTANLPPFVEIPLEDRDCCLTFKLPEGLTEAMADMLSSEGYQPPAEIRTSEEIQLERNPNYQPTDGRPPGTGWRSSMDRRIRKGENLLGDEPRRVVLIDIPDGFSDELSYGSLGWTVPEKGFFKKKGASTPYWATINFDNGITTDIRAWWFDFVVDDEHEREIQQVLEERSHYKKPVDTAAFNALIDSFSTSRVKRIDGFHTIGTGPFEVYAYTYESCLEEAVLNKMQTYPVKIGYVTNVGDSEGRVSQQILGSDEDAYLLMVGRCEDGIYIESAIHRYLKSENRRIKDCPGKEWYLTSAEEVNSLFMKFREAPPLE